MKKVGKTYRIRKVKQGGIGVRMALRIAKQVGITALLDTSCMKNYSAFWVYDTEAAHGFLHAVLKDSLILYKRR